MAESSEQDHVKIGLMCRPAGTCNFAPLTRTRAPTPYFSRTMLVFGEPPIISWRLKRGVTLAPDWNQRQENVTKFAAYQVVF